MSKVLTSPQMPAGRRITVDDQGSNSEVDVIVEELSGGGGGPPAPAISHMIFVSAVFGSDTLGDGTMGNPFATIAKANTTVTGATIADQWCVMIFPGEYVENVLLLPFVRLVGWDPSAFEFNSYPVRLNGIVGIGTDWAAASATASITNLLIDGELTLDYVVATSTDGSVSLTNVCITAAVTLNHQVDNVTEFHHCILDGSADTIVTGGLTQWFNTVGQNPNLHLIVLAGAGGPTFFNCFGGCWAGDVLANQNGVTDQLLQLQLDGFSTGQVSLQASDPAIPVILADYGATPENPALLGSTTVTLSPQMRVSKQLIIGSGAIIAAAGTTDVLIPLAGGVLENTNIEQMNCSCALVGADWLDFFTTQDLSISWVFRNNAGVNEIHCMIYTPGAGFELAVSLPFNFWAYLPPAP